MKSILYLLKGQATILNGILFLLVLAFLFYRFKKRKPAIVLASLALLVYLCCATRWLPNYLAGRMESKYLPLRLPLQGADTSKTLILVLGSGYSLDKRLPPNAQIGLVALGRLAEGIRIHRSLKNSVIICSGNSPIGLETQAEVTRKAAIALGVEPDRLETLTEPASTQEEAIEFRKHYLKSSRFILVTDALHMPRAIRLFTTEGFHPIADPTNYKVTEGPSQEVMSWWPSLDNVSLMNYVLHEWLGGLKASIEA
jgi:uncharacterized SAM-binding protein YcdF (DUF218 family)